jgi:hypothetical protein
MCGARPVQSLRWSMCTGRHDMSARTAVGDSVGRTTDTCPDQGWSSGAGANRARIATGWTICGSGGLVGLGYLRDASGCGPGCRCPVLPARLPSPSGTSDGKADPVCAVEHLYEHPDGRRRAACLSRDDGSLPPSACGWQGAWWKRHHGQPLWPWMANRPRRGGLPCTVRRLLRPRPARLIGHGYQADGAGRGRRACHGAAGDCGQCERPSGRGLRARRSS